VRTRAYVDYGQGSTEAVRVIRLLSGKLKCFGLLFPLFTGVRAWKESSEKFADKPLRKG
jgi:hypothetical protein